MHRLHALASLRASSSTASVGALDDPAISAPGAIGIGVVALVAGALGGMALNAAATKTSLAKTGEYIERNWDGVAKSSGQHALNLFQRMDAGTFDPPARSLSSY